MDSASFQKKRKSQTGGQKGGKTGPKIIELIGGTNKY